VASLARVRAERLEDTADASLRVGEPGEPGSLRWWPLKFMHSRVKRESSERKVVSVV
jgi:hypothetical protein